jgi:hypothetical protein
VTGGDVLRPSGRRTALRAVLGVLVGGLGIGAATSGAWPVGLVLVAVGGWLLAMTALILLRPRAYELHVDDAGFRVHDILGRPAHDLRWTEVVDLFPVNVNAFSVIVVAWRCEPRRPKQGRLRWRRGTRDDDGCMPDTYDRRADELIFLMSDHWRAGTGQAAAPGPAARIEPF